MSHNHFYFIDLFCGAGGLSCGLEMAGMKCAFATDHNNLALESFKLNHKKAETFLGPIESLDLNLLKEKLNGKKIRMIAGGPPCQGFSTSGKGDPNDVKNSLFLEYCRVVDFIKPDYILFENVTGLLALKNRHVVHQILEEFERIGYRVRMEVLNSSHYGVPQIRKRTIIFGTRLKKLLNFPEGKASIKTLGDALNQISNYKGEIFNHNIAKSSALSPLVREVLAHIPEGKSIRYKKDCEAYIPPNIDLNIDWENLKEGRLREARFHRLDRSFPANTVQTSTYNIYHPTDLRHFTNREIASIQSFPMDFRFAGSITSINKQIGNAVPPIMAKEIGKHILKIDKTNQKFSLSELEKMETFNIGHLASNFSYKRKKDN